MKDFLLFLFILLTGVCPLRPECVYVDEDELVALKCKESYKTSGKVLWKNETSQMYLHNISAAEQERRNLLLNGSYLIILSASVNHQGSYSCSPSEVSSRQYRFTLKVCSRKSRGCGNQFYLPCIEAESCSFSCPDSNVPPWLTTSIIWTKPDREQSSHIFFSSVKKKDGGVYTCFISYNYHGQMYNKTFRIRLEVQSKALSKYPTIIEPKENQVFYVDIDSSMEIHCRVADSSLLDDVYWCNVTNNDTLPVFYKTSYDDHNKTASLVFRKVSEHDLTKTYTCKLESVEHESSIVSITLSRKVHPSSLPLVMCSVCVVLAMVVTVVVYAKFKVDIILFMRDTLGCHRSASDGKSYDIFLMSYKSDAEGEMNRHDRKMLESALEERFGYSLCLFDRDVLPGESIAEAVLDCVERSRTVVLVPTSPDPGLESGLLSALHAAFVERQTRLVFVNTEKTGVLSTGSIPEALQLLSEAGDHVTWKGRDSLMPSSTFWKQLRYYLPASHRAPKPPPNPTEGQGCHVCVRKSASPLIKTNPLPGTESMPTQNQHPLLYDSQKITP